MRWWAQSSNSTDPLHLLKVPLDTLDHGLLLDRRPALLPQHDGLAQRAAAQDAPIVRLHDHLGLDELPLPERLVDRAREVEPSD